MEIYLAELSTFNYEFRAVGKNRTLAVTALQKGLRSHCKGYGLDYGQFIKDWKDSIRVMGFEPGQYAVNGEVV